MNGIPAFRAWRPAAGADSPYDTSGLVVGIDSEYMEGGTAFSEYRMYDAFGARQAQLASGLRNQWRVSPEVTLNTAIERLKVLDGRVRNRWR